MSKKVLVELQYLPTLEFFACIHHFDEIVIEAQEQFIKQSFRNRTHILTANGLTSLTIPVLRGNSKVPIREIEIDHSQKWANDHWRGIQSAYGKAPFFEFYAEDFRGVYDRNEKYLFDFNWQLLTLCLKYLQIDKNVELTKTYGKHLEGSIIDGRSVIHPKTDFNQNGYYKPVDYIQLFGNKFVPNMSVVDLLFCEGPNASNIIAQSVAKP